MKIKTKENSPLKQPDTNSASQFKSELVPIMDALYVINGKWRIPITIVLMEGNKRFSEIQKEVHKITAKVLAHELKEMELNGFVEKKINDENPAKTEYQLTEYSRSLEPVLNTLRDFGIQHRKKIRDESVSQNKSITDL